MERKIDLREETNINEVSSSSTVDDCSDVDDFRAHDKFHWYAYGSLIGECYQYTGQNMGRRH